MKKNLKLNSARELGNFLGLRDVDMELIDRKKALVEKLVRARKAAGLSQAELAELCGTKQPSIARMESGAVGQVSLDFIAKVALILGVSLVITKAAS